MNAQSALVHSIRHLTQDTFILALDLEPSRMRAGQCFSLGTSDLAINREYSIFSGEYDNQTEFLIRRVSEGSVSQRLGKLEAGDSVEVGGPYGSFTLEPEDVHRNKYVFIASGTGLAPFVSFVRTFPQLDYQVLHGIRYEQESYGDGFLDPARYFTSVSAPSIGQGERLTNRLQGMPLLENTRYYLCGNRNMISDAVSILRERNVPGGSIFMETFF